MRLKSMFLLTVCLSFFSTLTLQAGKHKSYSYITEQAIFDQVTEAYYLFAPLPTDPNAMAYANQHQVFFADPHKLVLFLPTRELRGTINKLGHNLKKIAEDAYEIQVNGDVMEYMQQLRALVGARHVLPAYVGHSAACPVYNDTHLQTPVGTNTQWHISDKPWIATAQDGITHDLDTVETLKSMFGLGANSVMVNFYDSGVDSANIEFTGRVAYNYNFQNYNATVTPDNHATSIGYHLFANANNNSGGVGMYGDKNVKNIRNFDIGGIGAIFIYAIYDALDSMIVFATNNPTQKQIHNFSFSISNDPIVQSKIQTLKAMQGGTQNFFVASSGNGGNASSVTYPAAYPEVFGVGAVSVTLPKTIWSGSATGTEVNWVADGEGLISPLTNGNYTAQDGTSLSCGIIAGAMANFLRLQNGMNSDTLKYYFDKSSYDLGAAGVDNIYGAGYMRLFRAFEKYAVQPFPTTFNAASNPNYSATFTPRFFNTNYITARRCYYPNGTQAVAVNNAGTVSFTIVMNTNNGFTASGNVLRYEMDFPNGCTVSFFSNPFDIQNLVTLGPPPPTPVILNVDPSECVLNPIQTGKLTNPEGTIAISLDASPITYNATDSTFNYAVGSVGTHTITVTYTNVNGSSFKDTIFTTTPASTPTISIATPQTTVCPGNATTFTATATNQGSSPSYQWKLNGSNVGTNASTYTNSTLVTGDIITCILTSNKACITSATATSNAITMTVAGFVTPSVSITTFSTTVCSGSSTIFTATPVNGGSSPAYQWKVNGLNAGTNSATFSTSSLVNGDIVTCVLISSAACLVTPTATSNALTMSVTPLVTPTISISASGTTICAGSNVTFTANASNQGSAPSYQWKVNSVNVGTNSSTYASTTLNNGDIVSCTLTSNATCPSTTQANSNSITMTVNPIVTPTIGISTPSATICAGAATTFTATVTNQGSAPTYQWKKNGINVGNNSTTYSVASLNNGDVITCVLTSNANCASPTLTTSNDITMIVISNTPSVVITCSDTVICAGDNTTFTATPTNGGNAPGYQWFVNNVSAGTNSNTFASTTFATGDIITCVMTSNEICLTAPSALSNAITMTVNPYVDPIITISTASTTVCAGDSIVFTSTVTNGGTAPSFQWRLNAGPVGTNSPTYGNNTLATGDVIRCRVTSNAECLLSPTDQSNLITMTVNPNSVPTISITSNITSAYTTMPVTYTAVTNVPSPFTVKWIRNGNYVTYTPGLVWNTYMIGSSDTVEAWIIPNSGCWNPDSIKSNIVYVKNLTSVGEFSIPGLYIYPNPSSSFVNVEGLMKDDELIITDVVGHTLQQQTVESASPIQLNVNSYSEGIYFIRIKRDHQQQLVRFQKN